MKDIFSKKNRALLAELVRTDFKLRYQGSMLGYTWSLLKPLLLFLILYVVFVKFLNLGNEIPHYPVYLLLGLVCWQFFSDITGQGLTSIVTRGELIRKIRIPRWIIVLSSSFSAVINFSLNLIVVAFFMILNGTSFSNEAVWLPVLFAEIFIFAFGLALILSTAYVKYRDVSYIWEVCLQAGFYITPILYPLQKVTNVSLQKVILLNPLAQAIQDARSAVVTKQTITIAEAFGTPLARLLPLTISIAFLVLGVVYFKRNAKDFAENL